MRIGVLLLIVILLERASLAYSPVNMATVAGQPVTMSCGVSSGDGLIRWKFQSIQSHEPKLLFNGYNISKGLPKHFISDLKAGEFNLLNSDPNLEDAGTYECVQTIEKHGSYSEKIGIAQLTVFSSAPNCDSNASNGTLVENDRVLMWCSVDYLGNLNPVMEWSRGDGSILYPNASYINASYPFTLTTTASEMMTSNDQNITYICKTYFTTPAALDPEKSDTFTARNAPDYRDECKLTISALYGPRNLSITPRKKTYTKGDRIRCSASANPPPTYSWKDAETEHTVDGSFLTVDDAMEQRRTSTYRCTAENIIAGEKKTTSETIAFNVADLSSGRSLNVIVGTGAAVGGIVITVVGVILWRLTNRKCYIQPEENESQGSPHDYESVNSGDMDSTQHTPDIEMNQSSIMANQTVDQSMTEAEEDLAVAETLSHYDTLDGSQTMQAPPPYSTLEAPNPEDQINQEEEISGKSHDYYNVHMSSVVCEQDIHFS